MTSAALKPHTLPVKLSEGRRDEIVAGLNASLANMIDISTSAKQAHWNVVGPNFQGLHSLFDAVAQEAADWGDLLAERLVALGGMAHGTLEAAASGTNLSSFPLNEHRWETLVQALHDRLLITSERLRGFADPMGDDIATQDVYVEILRGLEKRAWMLDAHLSRTR